MGMVKNTPSKGQIRREKALGRILPGNDGKMMRDAAKRHTAQRASDLSQPKKSLWKKLTG